MEFEVGERGGWKWTLLIGQPPHVTNEHLDEAIEVQNRNRRIFLEVELSDFEEGTCVQALHLGAYAEEPATIARTRSMMESPGVQQAGKHHEIYLGDSRQADPKKLKTVLRWPVQRFV